MKVLCISDQVDPIVYSTSIKSRFQDIDIVLSAGDLPLEYLGFIVSCLNKPLLFVFGNHNLGEYEYYKKNRFIQSDLINRSFPNKYDYGAEYIGFKTKKEANILFAGLGGSMLYNHGPNQFTELQMFLHILKLMPKLLFNRIFYGRFCDIVVTHAPPQGIHDKTDTCHRGFKCYKWFMHVCKPKYLIHGHIHLYDLNDVRISVFENTTIINAFGHHILELEL